jgi:hypothetical protein
MGKKSPPTAIEFAIRHRCRRAIATFVHVRPPPSIVAMASWNNVESPSPSLLGLSSTISRVRVYDHDLGIFVDVALI